MHVKKTFKIRNNAEPYKYMNPEETMNLSWKTNHDKSITVIIYNVNK